MSAINPVELMRATAVTYIRVQCRNEKHRLYRPHPQPSRDIIYYQRTARVIFRPPVIPRHQEEVPFTFPGLDVAFNCIPSSGMSPMRTLILRRYYEVFALFPPTTNRNFSFWQHNSRLSRNRSFFFSLLFSFSPPLSLSLFNFQHRAEFRGISPPRKSLVPCPEIATKILLIHGTNEGSSLILLEKFRNERKREGEREGGKRINWSSRV